MRPDPVHISSLPRRLCVACAVLQGLGFIQFGGIHWLATSNNVKLLPRDNNDFH